MKIAVADTTISGELIGGAQTFVAKLLTGLAKRGHDVHFVSGGEPNARMISQLAESGARLTCRDWTSGKLVDDATPALASWLNRLKPDVYVVSVSPDVGWTVLPHVYHHTATLAIAHSDSRGFYDPLKHYSRFVTRAIGVSEEICRQFVEYSGLPEEAVTWVPYGVEVSESTPTEISDRALRLAFVGRLANEDKRAGDLIHIAKALSASGLDFEFEVVGDGPLFAKFESELSSELESGKVKLHGWVSGAEVLNTLRASEVFLLTSDSEGFCIALVEAMANGCCPVVTDIRSGNRQLVEDGKNGFVVPVGDIDAFVDRITILAADRQRTLEMQQAAWETGRQYSLERMVDNYIFCFERALEDSRVNPRTPEPDFPLMPSCRSKYPLWLRRMKARFVVKN
jgi:glycosyltransferase involved in cell wall biosynthesis